MSLRMALLGLLIGKGPASGYSLSKDFQDSLSHVWSASHSQVYPELSRMAEKGLVTVGAEGPRGRKSYTVTDAGRAELDRWLSEERPSRAVRSEIALRAFLLPLVDVRRGLELIRDEGAYQRERSRQLDALRAKLDDQPGDGFGRYAAELGARVSRALAEWADWASEQLQAEDGRGRQAGPPGGTQAPPEPGARGAP